jgi:ATP-dependent Clp protease ATP-binding subunit ClpA
MTSNVGAKDVSEKPKGIGFVKDDNRRDGDKEIIIKSIKKEFKPEFINRIDNICYFTQLTDDNLKIIIKNEIKKVEQKVNNIGFTLDTDITEGKLLDTIFESVKEQSEYGARPILREIQIQLENKLTDFIINNDLPTNYNIKYIDIYK